MSPVVALLILGGSSLAVWAGVANPAGGVLAAVSRVLRGQPAKTPPPADGATAPPANLFAGLIADLNAQLGAAPKTHPAPARPGADEPAPGGRAWPTSSHTITEPYHVPGPWAAGYHTGVDIGAPEGAPVWAPVPGRIVAAGWDGAYGKCVQIKSGGLLVLLAHLSHIDAGTIPGRHVAAGHHLGLVGATGNATGPHLHVEARRAPYAYGDDVNPAVVLTGATAAHPGGTP